LELSKTGWKQRVELVSEAGSMPSVLFKLKAYMRSRSTSAYA